ncbi:MAG: hypothetical protein ACO1OB_34275 [Archangium sp.]
MATRAKWSSAVVQSVGREALALASTYRAELEPRLPAGLLDGLKADLDAFDGKRADASNALGTLMTATREQNAVAEEARELLSAARTALLRSRAGAPQRAAFGLKLTVTEKKVSSVVAALDAFADGAAKYPDAARAAGVLPSDVESMKELRAALVAVDQAQETSKSKRKDPVEKRIAAQQRIESAIDSVINAGRMAFVERPDVAGRFKALTPAQPSRSKKTKPPAA